MDSRMFVIAFLASIAVVNGLECYECSSLIDEGCGSTFDLSAKKKEEYKVTCNENGTACVKSISELPNRDKNHVVRRCYELTNTERSTPKSECTEYMGEALVCYCRGDKCNGQSPLQARYGVIALLFVFLSVWF